MRDFHVLAGISVQASKTSLGGGGKLQIQPLVRGGKVESIQIIKAIVSGERRADRCLLESVTQTNLQSEAYGWRIEKN